MPVLVMSRPNIKCLPKTKKEEQNTTEKQQDHFEAVSGC